MKLTLLRTWLLHQVAGMPERVAISATAECAHPAVSLVPVVPRSAAPRSRLIPNPVTPTPRCSGKRSRAASPAVQPGLPYPRLTLGGGLDLGPLLVVDPSAANGCARPYETMAVSCTCTCICYVIAPLVNGAPALTTQFCGSFACRALIL